VVTTDYVNALGVIAGSVAAENITGTTITGKTLRTASSGSRTELSPFGYYTGLTQYDSDNIARIFINTTDTGAIIRFYDYYSGSQRQVGSLSQYGYSLALTQNTGCGLILGNSGEDTLSYGNWDFSGASVTGLSGYATVNHNHDDRYYTESESDSRYIEAGTGGSKTIDKINATDTGLVIWFTDGTTKTVLYD